MWTGKPQFLRDHPGKISEAFIYNGVTYYTFEDMFQMPTSRGLQALDVYDEFNMRCDKDFLIQFVKAQREILSNPKKLDLIRLATLTKNLQERLEMLPVPDHIFKLASVIFFDDTENPFYYDRAKAAKKIELWKKDPEILAFFLRTPIKDLVNCSDLSQVNLATYTAVMDMINKMHWNEVSLVLSEKGTKEGLQNYAG